MVGTVYWYLNLSREGDVLVDGAAYGGQAKPERLFGQPSEMTSRSSGEDQDSRGADKMV